MKRILLIVPAFALFGAAAPKESSPPSYSSPARIVSPQPSVCQSLESIARGRDRLGIRRLGELPPGEAYMAVYRTDERGCIDPMLASERQGIGRR